MMRPAILTAFACALDSMPVEIGLEKLVVVLMNDSFNLVQLVIREPAVLGHSQRQQPELGPFAVSSHVDVRRFVPFVRKKMEPIRPVSQHSRHLRNLDGAALIVNIVNRGCQGEAHRALFRSDPSRLHAP